MTKQITPREWDALSAYLDGQLSSKDRIHLERRLEERADLRIALEGLRQTRMLLRSQPPLRAPRNFMLSPEQAGIRTKPASARSLFPVMRLATVLASVLFLLVVAGDLLTGGRDPVSYTQAYRSGPMAAQIELQEAEKQLSSQNQADYESPAPIEAPAAAEEAYQKGFEATQPVSEEMSLMEIPAIGESYPSPSEVIPEGSGLKGTAIADSLPETTTPTPTDLTTTQVESIERDLEAALVTSPTSHFQSTWYLWRLMEITLILLALGTGVIAFVLSRSGRA